MSLVSMRHLICERQSNVKYFVVMPLLSSYVFNTNQFDLQVEVNSVIRDEIKSAIQFSLL